MKKTSLSLFLLCTISSPFAAAPELTESSTLATASAETMNPTHFAIPRQFENDLQLKEIIEQCNHRERTIGSSVHPRFHSDHIRHTQGRIIGQALRDALTALNSPEVSKDNVLSKLYNELVPLRIKMFSINRQRMPSPGGDAIYAYDINTLCHLFDWIHTNLTQSQEILISYKTLRVLELLITPIYGSKEFCNAVENRTLTLESAEVFFRFLEDRHKESVIDSELTLQDCVALIGILNPNL